MSRLFPSVPRTDFGPAPPGYVPGLGRGAVGFTTRSDIGPARPMAEEAAGRGRPMTVPALAPQFGRATPTVAGAPSPAPAAGGSAAKAADDAEIAKYSDSNFDEFSGFNEQLFATGEYDAEDKEADMIYEAIDRRMDSKRKRQREESLKAELERTTKMPAIHKQFAEIKRTLKDIPLEAWEAIPEALDYSHQNKLKNKENARERFTPLPDNILAGAAAQLSQSTSVVSSAADDHPMTNGMGGSTAAALGTITPDLTSIGRARDKVLSMRLGHMADSVSGQTVVDPKGYMTQMAQGKVTSDTEVSDIKKAQLLLRSVIQTNPRHGPGWIAAARLEKETGKLSQARQIMLKGCEMAPGNEDVWIEAAALQTPQAARAILAKAVLHLPTSVNIWLMAANLESDIEAQKAVLRRALEHMPTSVRLWKTAVQLESPDEARIMLSRAVELIPASVEMWLALAKLETYEQARVVLNRARKAIPTDASIWLTAARLEEAHGNGANVDLIVSKAVASLAKFQVVIDRDSWLQAAEEAERADAPATARAIVKHTVGLGVEELDRKLTWTQDASTYEAKGSFGVARAIAQHLCEHFPTKKSAWLKAAHLERAHGTKESLAALLTKACAAVPTAEILWLMRAKEAWLAGDVPGARAILTQAFEANRNSEEIWLAAMKLEYESREFERARALLTHARAAANTPRVWMKSAKMERLLNDPKRQQELLEEALKRFPDSEPKLHLMYAQLLTAQGNTEKARDAYKRAVKEVGTSSVDVWIQYAKFEVELGMAASSNTIVKDEPMLPVAPSAHIPSHPLVAPSAASLLTTTPFAKARSILETARLKMPHQPRLWIEAIRIELLAGNKKAALWLQAKSLQDCPTSGLVWAMAIALDDRPKKKSRSFEALERCNEDAYVLMAVAKLFWLDRKLAKARSWFARAAAAQPTLGDVWIFALKFEMEHGTPQQQQALLDRCAEADPTHGEVWTSISKDDRNAQLKPRDIVQKGAAKLAADVFSPFAPK